LVDTPHNLPTIHALSKSNSPVTTDHSQQGKLFGIFRRHKITFRCIQYLKHLLDEATCSDISTLFILFLHILAQHFYVAQFTKVKIPLLFQTGNSLNEAPLCTHKRMARVCYIQVTCIQYPSHSHTIAIVNTSYRAASKTARNRSFQTPISRWPNLVLCIVLLSHHYCCELHIP